MSSVDMKYYRRSQPANVLKAHPARKHVSFNQRVEQSSAQKTNKSQFWADIESPSEERDLENAELDSPLFPELASVQQTLQLHTSKVDLFGYEVEKFAEHVDRWQKKRNAISTTDSAGRFEAGTDLLGEFETIAKERLAETQRECNTRDPLSKSWRGRLEALKGSKSVQKQVGTQSDLQQLREVQRIQKWKAEVETWDLLRSVTDLYAKKPSATIKQMYKNANQGNKYSSDSDLWTGFIIENDAARERKVILEWLERTASSSETTFDAIVEQLEFNTGTKGTWSHGALHTREKIKQDKRLRSMAGATSIKQTAQRATDSPDFLVTQLDPDAPTRQKRTLEKQDQHYERSLWLACYEMLRRGTAWVEIRDWLEERNEGWRAASLGAAQNLDRKSSRLCLSGPHAGALWRRMCLAASRQTSADVYERAVYGLLAGDTDSVEPVCQTWEDLVFMNYNSFLLNSFETWLQTNHPDRFPSVLSQKFPLYKPVRPDAELDDYRQHLLEDLIRRPKFAPQANQPINWIQANLVSGNFKSMIRDLGIELARIANENGDSSLIPRRSEGGVESTFDYTDFARDSNALRIVVHMLIIFREAGLEYDAQMETNLTDIFVSYLDLLRVQGKLEAIPTYASFIKSPHREETLSRVLFDVSNHAEQDRFVKLMSVSELNVTAILNDQFRLALNHLNQKKSGAKPTNNFHIVAPAAPRWAGWRICPGLPNSKDTDEAMQLISEDESRVVWGLQWFFRCNSKWEHTFSSITFVLKEFFKHGQVNAALAVTKAVPFREMSMRKSVNILSRAVDVFEDFDFDEIMDEQRVQRIRYTLDILRQESRQCYEMQQLAMAIEACAEWRAAEEALSATPPELLRTKDVIDFIEEHVEHFASRVKPLLNDFMTHLANEADVADFNEIRQLYLPEIILAYNGALCFAAEFVGVEVLLQSLELGNIVADDANSELAEAFVASGRMSDLVTSLAYSSRKMLSLNQGNMLEERRTKKAEAKAKKGSKAERDIRRTLGMIKRKRSRAAQVGKRGWTGETVDIWDPDRIDGDGV